MRHWIGDCSHCRQPAYYDDEQGRTYFIGARYGCLCRVHRPDEDEQEDPYPPPGGVNYIPSP